MPISIDTVENTFANPIGLMSDCHRRIERFLSALSAVASQAGGGPLNDKQWSALEAALQYFHQAAPRHTADEEEDLFPLLRELGRAHLSEVLKRVERLEGEHKKADAWHQEVEQIGRRWLRQNCISEHETTRLRELLASLSDLYSAHIALEEKLVFPVAQTELSDADKQVIGRRMAARRGVPFRLE